MNAASSVPSRLLLTAAFGLTFGFAGCKSATPPPDDNALNSALQTKLMSDVAIASEPIQTFVQGGVATLQGNVSSEAAKALAASDASAVPGIKSVANQLSVETAPPPTMAAIAPPVQPPPTRPGKPSALVQRPPQRLTPAYNPPPPSNAAPIERRDGSNLAANAPPPVELQHHAPPPPAPPAFHTVTVPTGTTLSVRITQTLDSATTQQGDAFAGTVASDVLVDGLVAIPAGTAVNGRVDEVHEAGHFKGSSLLTLSLVSLNRHGEATTVSTDPYTQTGNGRGKNTAEKVGGGAAVGAILGGIFGGGKGAAIGGLAGGGLGAGAQAVTRGQQTQIASETLLRFRISNPVEVRASTAPEGDTNLQRHPSN